jgi:MFS family permease
MTKLKDKKEIALHFIILMGIVSLLGDIAYEGARSVTGPYLYLLGASAFVVSLIGGLGEFIGYAFRLFSGLIADKTKAYWILTFMGYGLILTIPLLAFVNLWWVAAILLILERIGKAIRSPSRDAILSYATKKVGRGYGFGIHEVLDQIGAIIGPLIFSSLLLFGIGYNVGFSILFIPTFLLLYVLTIAKKKVPLPEKLEKGKFVKKKLSRVFILYSLFTFFSVAGFLNFQLISYHLKINSIVVDALIPTFYAIAMGIDAFLAFCSGIAYDKIGLKILLIIPILTVLIPFLSFSINPILSMIGVILWGATLGVHETVMRAAVADLTSIQFRGSAYGVFNTMYGLSWIFGGVVAGFLYEISIFYLSLFIIILELVSAFFLLKMGINHF